jgi:hypothetical protein
MQEWILAPDENIERFASGQAAASFEPAGAWTHDASCNGGTASLAMQRESDGWRIQKTIELPASGERIAVTYACTNTSGDHRTGRFVSEWNVSAPQASDGDDRIARIDSDAGSAGLHDDTGSMHAASVEVRGSASWAVRAETDLECDVWHFPVHTVSSSEGGLERVVQGASVSFVRDLSLDPGASFSMRLAWSAVDDR